MKKGSSNTLLSKKSHKDIEGPINSSVFFRHDESRKLSDDYYIGKVIGQGAYGKVRLVTHKQSGLVRASKHIRKKSVQSGKLDTLFDEVNILMKLVHPNIVQLFGLYEDKKNYIMVTEYCSGGELFERIQNTSSFSEAKAAHYMRQILSCVHYLHSKGIVHRDLKAENLLFENETDEANLKLIDFGVSTKFDSGKNKKKKMRETLGTVSYLLVFSVDF